MKRHDVEKKIYEAFDSEKPELFQKILEQCPDLEIKEPKRTLWQHIGRMFSYRGVQFSFASLSVLILVVIAIIGLTQFNNKVYSLIALDVNPSLMIELDKKDNVVNVITNNTDAEMIIGNMDLIGVDSNVAINAIIGSMVIHGYINESSNSLLLSIQSNDLIKQEELRTRYTQVIIDLLSSSTINGSVMSQVLVLSQDAEDLSEQLGISEAKAELILSIAAIDPRVIVEDLSLLSINDLNILLEAKNYAIDHINHVGNASNLSMITQDEAYQIALNDYMIDEMDVIESKIKLDQDDGLLLYEVYFKTNTAQYEVTINAKSGLIYDREDELIDDDIKDEIYLESEIMTIIESQLSLSQTLMEELEIELKSENGVPYYEVSFKYGETEYDIEINALNGNIISNSMDNDGYDHDDEEDD